MSFPKSILVLICFVLLKYLVSFCGLINGDRPAISKVKIRTFVISATYSRFEHTINIVILSERELRHIFRCRTRNTLIGNESISSPAAIYAYDRAFLACKWFHKVAECSSVSSPTNLALTSVSGELIAPDVPIRYAETVQREVVVCVPPLFLYERWRQLIICIEIYQHYGAERISVYLSHALHAVFKLLKAYEAAGIVSLSLWPTLPKIGDFNPNHEIESRNQPAAYDDCLYLYKESARFIIFADVDDILVPRLGQTYAQEFQLLAERWPLASTFMYNRISAHLYRTRDTISLEQFRLNETLSATDTGPCFKTWFRKCVVIGDRVKNIHIHWSGTKSAPMYKDEEVPCEENSFLHFREWLYTSELQTIPNQLDITTSNMSILQQNYERLIRQHELLTLIPPEEVFMAGLEQCYAGYTWKTLSLQCMGPHLCVRYFQPQNMSCYVTQSQFDMPTWRANAFGVLRDMQIVEQNGCGEL